MDNTESFIPLQLARIIEDFQLAEGAEKLELLLEYAEKFTPVESGRLAHTEEREAVPECMTPVFLYTEFKDDGMVFYFDIPKESPTVRGFAELLREGLEGCTPEQILAIPADIYLQFGLEKVLTHQRLRGMAALIAHIKHHAMRWVD
jgi:cysteine desulfuration protein SufE